MVKIDFDEHFKKTISKIKDSSIKERIERLIIKIKNNPQLTTVQTILCLSYNKRLKYLPKLSFVIFGRLK